jgi:5-amino-6-(D-ribitylamino)uracil---L-tyrosine 4-hydroxyphenyl transferase
LKPRQIRAIIRSCDRLPAQRSTTYRLIKQYSNQEEYDQPEKLDKADTAQFSSYHQLIKLDKFRYSERER